MSDQFNQEFNPRSDNQTHGFKKFTNQKNAKKCQGEKESKRGNLEEMDDSQMYSEAEKTKKIRRWTFKEDELLQQLIEEYGEKSWRLIALKMNDRSPIQCLHRWTKILKPGLVKGPWSLEEDEKLLEWVKTYGSNKWSICAENIPGRSGKQCRERWFNNLNPNVKKGNWTSQEDEAIFNGYLTYGSSWSKIAKELAGRTENSVKNRFYSTVRKLLADVEWVISKKTDETAIQNMIRMHLDKTGKKNKETSSSKQQVMKQEVLEEEKSNKNEYDEDSHQSMNVKRRYLKKKEGDEYSQQNLLYRKLKDQGIPVKRTSCMKDYSMFYKKYKQNRFQTKKKHKENDKLKNLKTFLEESCAKQEQTKLPIIPPQLQLRENTFQPSLHQEQNQINQMESKIMEFFNRNITEIVQKFQAQFLGITKDDIKIEPKIKQDDQMPQNIQINPDINIITDQMQKKNIYSQLASRSMHLISSQNIIPEENNSSEMSSLSHGLHKVIPIQSKISHSNPSLTSGPQTTHLPNLPITPHIQNQKQSNEDQQTILQNMRDSEQIKNQMTFLQQLSQQFQREKGFSSNQDQQVDQKMIFLIQQLNTLENMLSQTKKELYKLESSLVQPASVQEQEVKAPSVQENIQFKINQTNSQKNSTFKPPRKNSNTFSDFDRYLNGN